MSHHKEEEEHKIDIGQVYTKSEQFVENNKKILVAAVGVVILVVAGYFGYKSYIGGQEVEAQASIWKAEYYFSVDSLDKALEGDGQYFGFEYISENFKGTKSANLANYYIGIIYKEKGDLEYAIEYLKKADIDDEVLGSVAIGSIGDCYIDLGNYDEAITYFNKAVSHSGNSFTAPIYLNKAAITYEVLGKYKEAARDYQKIIDDYSDSPEAKKVKKNLARVEQLSN
jgi:tetratricopeptide (TPR) repeat protein